MTAKLLKQLEGFSGDARLYELDEPMEYTEWLEEVEETKGAKFVVVSATVAPFSGPETYIFPADEQGEITSYGELEGSFRGGLSHATALNNAGYSIVV